MREFRRNMDVDLRGIERKFRTQPSAENREQLMLGLTRAGRIDPEWYNFYRELITDLPLVMAVTRSPMESILEHGLDVHVDREEEMLRNFAQEVEEENRRVQTIAKLPTLAPEGGVSSELLELCRCLLLQVYFLIPPQKAAQVLETSRGSLSYRRGRAKVSQAKINANIQLWTELRTWIEKLTAAAPRAIQFLRKLHPLLEEIHIIEDLPQEESFSGEDIPRTPGVKDVTIHGGKRPPGYTAPTPELWCYKKVMYNLFMLVLHAYLSLSGDTILEADDAYLIPDLMEASEGEHIVLAMDAAADDFIEGQDVLLRFAPPADGGPQTINWSAVYSNLIGGSALCMNLLNRCNTDFLSEIIQIKLHRNKEEEAAGQREQTIDETVEKTFRPYLRCHQQFIAHFKDVVSTIRDIDGELATNPTTLPESMAMLQIMGSPDHLDPPNGPETYFGLERHCSQLRYQEVERQVARDSEYSNILDKIRNYDQEIQTVNSSQINLSRIRDFLGTCLAMTILEQGKPRLPLNLRRML